METYIPDLIDQNKISHVPTKLEWNRLLEDGYIGLQSGNNDRIYFYNFDNLGRRTERIFAKTLFKHTTREDFDSYSLAMLHSSISRYKKYAVFAVEDLFDNSTKKAIIKKQNKFIPLSDEILQPTNQFNEELL